MKYFGTIVLATFKLSAQANNLPATNATGVTFETNQPTLIVQRAESMRKECIQGRRIICGKILKVPRGGLVGDSGYTDLVRPALSSAWLVPDSVVARRPANLMESHEPGSACVGISFISDLPKTRGKEPKPEQYDYLVLMGDPAGQSTYSSVGAIQRNVRHFSGNLLEAVNLSLETEGKSGAVSTPK